MGVVHYKNTLMLHANTLFNEMIQNINSNLSLNTIEKKEAALEADLQHNQSQFTLQIPNQEVSTDSNLSYWFPVEDQHASYINNSEGKKIAVTFKSIGKIDTTIEKSITATIEFKIDQLIETKTGGEIGNGKMLVDLKETGLKKCTFSGELQNLCAYDYPDLTIPDINGGIDKDYKIYIVGNATFGDINGGIKKNSELYIGGNASFGKISSETHKDAKICVGGTIKGISTDKNKKYPEGIYSYKDDIESYNNSGCPPIIENNNAEQLSFNPILMSNLTKISNLSYN